MAVNERHMELPRANVWDTLADADTYEDWVVGASEVRKTEGDWPTPGATFHHTQAIPVVGLKDTTTVIEADTGRRLKLEVRARPLVVAEVILELEDVGGGTLVTMRERPIGGLGSLVPRAITDIGLRKRNAESLRRLEEQTRERARNGASA